MNISIVIPTYNRLAAVLRTIDSVACQLTVSTEVIVVDDASTDGTAGWLHRMTAQHNWLKLIVNSCNAGVNYARNRGIEAATGKYIVFIDSDDQLAAGALEKITNTIKAHAQTMHFLFLVSDQKEAYEQVQGSKELFYKDWISAAVQGDFIHVVRACILKQYLFFEQFRMYEYLNWLRIQKVTSPQLLVPFVAAERERERTDSLTRAAKLSSRHTIQGKFEALHLYYNLYHVDLKTYHRPALKTKLLTTILLGVACNKKRAGYRLLQLATKPVIKILGVGVLLLPPVMCRKVISYWSASK